MDTKIQHMISSNIDNLHDTITFILKHNNNTHYNIYNHSSYIDMYKYLFIKNHTNHKLYNLDKYLSYIHYLDINHATFTKASSDAYVP